MSDSSPSISLASVPRSSWNALILLLLINLVNYMDRYVLAAIEPLLSADLLKDDPNAGSKMGALATGFLVAYMVSAPIFGMIADRWRRWGIVGLGVLLWSLATAGCGLASGFVMLAMMRLCVGVGEGGFGPVAPTLIADLFPVSRRGLAMSIFYIAIPVGSAIGYAVGGELGTRFGWREAFFAVSVPGLILGMLAIFKKDPPRGDQHAAKSAVGKKDTLNHLRLLVRNPAYLFAVGGMTLMTFAVGGMSFWAPRYLAEERGAGTLKEVNWTFGLIMVITGLTATVSGGWVADRLRKKFRGAYLLVSGLSMLIAFPLTIAMLYVPFPACWIVIALALFFLFFNTGPSNTVIANVTSPAVRTTAFAMSILTIHALGDAISPLVIGRMKDLSGGKLSPGFMLVAMTVLVSGIVWTIGTKFVAKAEDLAESKTQS